MMIWPLYALRNDQAKGITEEEAKAIAFLQELNSRASEMCTKSNFAEWRYASDITDQNDKLKVIYPLI